MTGNQDQQDILLPTYTASPARLDSLTAADIALAGTVGKDKEPSQQRPQHAASLIMTLVVSCCGSGLYAYGRAMGPIGYVPSVVICIVTLLFATESSAMIARATGFFSMPFDLAITEILGTFSSYLGNGIATLMLVGLLIAYSINLTKLWMMVVYKWFLTEDASYWAGLATTNAVNFLTTTFIPNTAILVKICSFSIVSIFAAVIGLIYQAVTSTTAASAQCALDVLKHPSHAPAFGGSTLHAVGNLFAIVGVFNSSYFLHNSYETYFVAHPTPNKRILHLSIAHVLATLVYFITGFAAMVPSGCNTSNIPDNSVITIQGPVGIICQILFLIQVTSVFPILTSVVRSATVERLPWRRAAEGGNFGWASFVRMFSRQRPRNAIQIVNEFVDDGTRTVAPTTDAAEAARAAAEAVRGGGLDESRLAPAEVAGTTTSAGDALVGSTDELTTESDKEDAGAFELGAEMPLEVMVDVADPDAAAALRVAAAEVDANAEVRPPFVLVLGANIVIIGLCVLFGALKVSVTTVLSYLGAFAGWIYVYTLPPLFWLKKWKTDKKFPIMKTIVAVLMLIFGFVSMVGTFIPKE